MRITPTRRFFVQSIIAGLSFGPAILHAQSRSDLPVLQRWSTGNSRLNPLSEAGGALLFCGDKTVGAIALASREPLWIRAHGFDNPAEFRPRPSGALMVCGGRHWIAAFDDASGAEIWRHVAEIQTGVPLVTPTHTLFGDGHWLVALDTATGAERWRFAGVPDTLASYAPAATADTVFVGPGDGRLYALALADGALKWSVDGRQQWQYLRQITVQGDIIIAGTYKENLTGLAVADGKKLWSFNAGNFINSQHVANGTAYLWSPTGWVYAINTGSGKVRWRYQTTDYDGTESNWASVLAELQTLDAHLYVLSMDNVLHRLDIASGTEHLEMRVPDRIRHALLPIAGHGIAFPTEGAEILLTPFPEG